MSMKKSFLLLLTGNTAGQLITLLISPILTRIYSPDDFGLFSVYTSLLVMLLSFSTLCLEKAVPLEKDIANVKQLIATSGFAVIIVALIVAVLGLTPWSLYTIYGVHTTYMNSLLLSLGLVFAGIYQVMSYQLLGAQHYKKLTNSKLIQAVGNGASQLAISPMKVSSGFGLIIGDVIGRGVTTVYVTCDFFWKTKDIPVQLSKMTALLKKYRNFPLFSTWSTFLNVLSTQLIFLMLIRLYGVEITGYFSLTQKSIGMPITLIGGAISQIFYSEASRLFEKHAKKVLHLYLKIIKWCFLAGVIIFAGFAFISPTVFSLVFGSQWEFSGELYRSLVFLYIIQFAILPISQILYITGHQKGQLLIDALRLAGIIGGVFLLKMLDVSFEGSLYFYSGICGVSYIILGISGYIILKRNVQKGSSK
ncbi:lipopolysaccharide biosynthesis protein [Listeria booriae]|uniref:lipopolysaccharide biosynthesis protein n=1 Tax=Listeria booriae TaxID=1552123 RepID=UPI0016276FE1|nr:oligosaccharide flippase family protein [Listeria booriae]MBC2324178.1 oligosaccharide flippase family protein [Listeria booriae]MCD2208039.1 oligosaccharide flippase family protein [Listeria booriae]